MPKTLATGSEVLPAKRRAMVLDIVRRTGMASVQDITARIEASPSTIRRDLEYLTGEGLLERTHGGAMVASEFPATYELEPSINIESCSDEKQAIGAYAAGLIRSGESIIFDASSTVRVVAAKAVERNLKITAVTNHLDIGHICASQGHWRTYILGGALRENSNMVLGETAETQLSQMHADLCFLGTYSLTGTIMTDPLPEVAALKRRMIRSARRVVALADGSKFRAAAFAEFCGTEALSELVTDTTAPAEALEEIRRSGCKVTVVPTDGN